IPSVFRHLDRNTQTVSSLRDLVGSANLEEIADEFERMMAEGAVLEVLQDGIRHQVRTAMGLRDQPTLDKFQGEIFRLPLDQQLIILGPPGTGKTTTLIKRLSQKLKYLDSDEQRIAQQNEHVRPHKQSW